jgi:hypothetical protein
MKQTNKLMMTIGWWISNVGHWIASVGGRLRTKALNNERAINRMKTGPFD